MNLFDKCILYKLDIQKKETMTNINGVDRKITRGEVKVNLHIFAPRYKTILKKKKN